MIELSNSTVYVFRTKLSYQEVVQRIRENHDEPELLLVMYGLPVGTPHSFLKEDFIEIWLLGGRFRRVAFVGSFTKSADSDELVLTGAFTGDAPFSKKTWFLSLVILVSLSFASSFFLNINGLLVFVIGLLLLLITTYFSYVVRKVVTSYCTSLLDAFDVKAML